MSSPAPGSQGPNVGSPAPAAVGTNATAGPASTAPTSSDSFPKQLLRGLEAALVTGLGTFAASPALTSGQITGRNLYAAGIGAGVGALWALAKTLGYNNGP